MPIWILVSKMVFMKYLPGQINPKIKITLKVTFDISSIPVLTMRSDKSFIEYLLHVMPNWSPILNSNLNYKM